MSPEPLISRSTVQLRLHSMNGPIARLLQERVSVKLGRQVRSALEKAQALEEPPEPPETQPDEDLVHPRADSTPVHPSFVNALPEPNQEKPITELQNTTDTSVWFKSKVVSRSHAEIYLKDGQVYLRDVGSSSGTFLNKMRLSPANKMSRPYPLREGDCIQLGVDYQGRTEGKTLLTEIYRAVELQISMDVNESHTQLQKKIPMRFRKALNLLITASNPHQKEEIELENSVDCCICISEIGPFQAIFIAPCSHCFHYKCINNVLKDNIMFPCPVCRQVANLEASVSMESVYDDKNWRKPLVRSKSSIVFSEGEMEISGSSPMHRPQFGLQRLLTAHHHGEEAVLENDMDLDNVE